MDLGRVGGDLRYGATNFMCGVAVAFYNYPTYFNSDGRFNVNGPFYSTLIITWTGGDAPYLLQKKLNVQDPSWQTVRTTQNTSESVPIEGAAAFFRVSGAAAP